ncbi:transmembrane and immunoglobulin domain-containing protein 1 [Nelusetta ayraudi]|uniref:transmembrane and immunoglobulin domain-containing protein 1 n=1 Tax=Nelusetta ayraudi TaxID=303726 RepID=UPI003F730B10
MKLAFGLLLHLLLSISTCTLGVQIQADPGVNSDGVVEVELDKVVSLVCEHVVKSEAGVELVWLRNGAAIQLKEGNTENRSVVCVTPIYDDNGATFTCHQRQNSTISSSVTLNVTFPPQLTGSEDITVEEEAEFHLTCDIWANPIVSNVVWTVNDSSVDLEEIGLQLTNDGFKTKLSTWKAERGRHEGAYKCSVTYFSEMYSKTFNLKLTDKTLKFPLMPMIAAIVIVALTLLLAIFSRWRMIMRCFK